MGLMYAGLIEKDEFIVQFDTYVGMIEIHAHRTENHRWMVRYSDVLYYEESERRYLLTNVGLEITEEVEVLENHLDEVNEYLQRCVGKEENAYIEYKDRELVKKV